MAFTKAKRAEPKIAFAGHWDNFKPEFYGTEWVNVSQSGQQVFPPWYHTPKFFPAAGKRVKNGFAGGDFVANDRLQIVDNASAPNGKSALRIEVRSGDHAVVHSGERVELERMIDPYGDELRPYESDGVQFIAMSIKLDAAWSTPLPDPSNSFTWGAFLQLHSPNFLNSPPAISLSCTDTFALEMLAGDWQTTTGQAGTRDTELHAFSDGSLNAGQWVDFVIEVKWSYSNTGYIKISRRNEGQTAFTEVLSLANKATLQYSSFYTPTPSDYYNTSHYWRTGFYRSTSTGLTNILHLGSLVVGSDKDAVISEAFEQE